MSTIKYYFGVAQPVARLAPGDILDTNTVDCFGGAIQKPGDTLVLVKSGNSLAGPFYIEGAEVGDTIAIDFLALEVNEPQRVGPLAPGFSAIKSTNYTPTIDPPLPERIWRYLIHQDQAIATFAAHHTDFSVDIPLHPFLGCIGVVPLGR